MFRFTAFCHRSAGIYCYSLLFLALSAAGPEPGAPFDRTPGFDVAYLLSFRLDYCGHFLPGELYRYALTAKLASCPFTEAARRRFRETAAASEAQARATIGRYSAEHKAPMEYLPDTKQSCAEMLVKPGVTMPLRRLARFAAGEISVDEAWPESCADGATPAPL
jgi:hypothetical protein